MGEVYTGTVRVRHDERDLFGRLRPAAYLRYLAQVAVDASTALGFDAPWYAAAGTHWIVRRSRLDVHAPVAADVLLTLRTWVAEFRRVRSLRRYELRNPSGALCAEGVTDWVYVDAASGKPRRLPTEVEARFGIVPDPPSREVFGERPPAAPVAPVRTQQRVRVEQLDPVGHVNNAAYLDVVVQGCLDALAARAWPLSRLIEVGAVPVLTHADLEYLAEARYGDTLTVDSWREPGPAAAVHHLLMRDGAEVCVRAATRWAWADPCSGVAVPMPDAIGGLLGAEASA